MKFNAKTDLDPARLYNRAETEAKLIHSKPSTARGRSLENIIETVMYGHAAELYLIDHESFRDDPREYKDVIDTKGNQVEVKLLKANITFNMFCKDVMMPQWKLGENIQKFFISLLVIKKHMITNYMEFIYGMVKNFVYISMKMMYNIPIILMEYL